MDDDDGTLAFTFIWQSSSDNSLFSNIEGATSSAYAIPSDQTFVDKFIRVQVISTDSIGGTTTKVSASQQVANVNDPPTVANPISDVTVDEDSPVTEIPLANVFSDVESDDLTLSCLLYTSPSPRDS